MKNDNPHKILNKYVQLRIVFHPGVIFVGSKEIKLLPGILVSDL